MIFLDPDPTFKEVLAPDPDLYEFYVTTFPLSLTFLSLKSLSSIHCIHCTASYVHIFPTKISNFKTCLYIHI
jgi:hypothetical protein